MVECTRKSCSKDLLNHAYKLGANRNIRNRLNLGIVVI